MNDLLPGLQVEWLSAKDRPSPHGTGRVATQGLPEGAQREPVVLRLRDNFCRAQRAEKAVEVSRGDTRRRCQSRCRAPCPVEGLQCPASTCSCRGREASAATPSSVVTGAEQFFAQQNARSILRKKLRSAGPSIATSGYALTTMVY